MDWRRVHVGIILSAAGAAEARGDGVADVLGDECGVAADAVDEVRAAVVLEALTEHVQARHRRDAAALADLTVAVEHRKVAATGRSGGGRWPRRRC